MHAALRAERVVRAGRTHLQRRLADAAVLERCAARERGRPAARGARALVHAHELVREQRGLGAADAGLDLEQRAEVRGRRRAEEERGERGGGGVRERGAQARSVRGGVVAEVGVREERQRLAQELLFPPA
jgi:hypothetical protein